MTTLSGKYSFMESRTFLEYTVASQYMDSKGRKTMHIMKEYYGYYSVGVAVPKYMPYLASFNRLILNIPEIGLYQKWKRDIIRKAKEIDKENKKEEVCINFVRYSEYCTNLSLYWYVISSTRH